MRLVEHVAALLLVALLIFGLANIVLRLTSGGGLIWYSDVARYGLAWMVFLGAGVVAFQGTHMAIETGLIAALPRGAGMVLRILRAVMVIGFLAILLWQGTVMVQSVTAQKFITVRWLSLAWGFAALPVGALLLLAAELWRMVRRSRVADEGRANEGRGPGT